MWELPGLPYLIYRIAHIVVVATAIIVFILHHSRSSKERGCSWVHVERLQVIPNTIFLTRNGNQPRVPITNLIWSPLRNLTQA